MCLAIGSRPHDGWSSHPQWGLHSRRESIWSCRRRPRVGNNNFWTAGASIGTCYFSPGNAPVTNQTSIANTRYIKAVSGSLFFSTQAGTAGIYTFQGGGLPKGSATTNLLFATGGTSQPAGFDLSPSLTVAYVADQRSSAGGIQKWVNNAGTWSLAYTFATGAGAFGVAVDFSGPAPVI